MNPITSFLLLLFSLISVAFCHQNLIIELPENSERIDNSIEQVTSWCSSWRIAGEANNLNPWNKVPDECVNYVKEYMLSKSYEIDLEFVSNEAIEFAKSFKLNEDGMDVWIFDIDETLLSNLPYYARHDYGSQIFDHNQFDEWVLEGMAPTIEPSLKVYEEVSRLGFKIFLLTGRTESKRSITINNLMKAGFQNWDRVILRGAEDHEKTAVAFKSEKRKEMVEEGFRIIGNSGDQWSDLIGSSVSMRSFKLSNPMYFIS
ncbi:acid phosphatase 1-like [Rutidosis leptorrhynchoides]|uniref:acid phosphatase 1-like n=1 Tax=Rutidosis leptorrhynchoides TaxID=125765 RepID=UPI003A992CE8